MAFNDNFADAYEVTLDHVGHFHSDPVDNTGFTSESGEPATSASSNKSAWWKWTPTENVTVQIDTRRSTGASQDTQMGIYTGTALNNLVAVGTISQDGGQGNSAVALNFSATAGTTYWIQVGIWAGAQCNYRLRVRKIQNTNDAWANATEVVIPDGETVVEMPWVETSAMSVETDEPTPTSGGKNQTAWWKYVPATSGTARFDTQETWGAADTEMAVYTGSALNALTKVASNSDSGSTADPDGYTTGSSFSSRITGLSVTADTTYWIQVGMFSTQAATRYGLRVAGPATEAAPSNPTGTLDITLPAPVVALSGAYAMPTAVGDLSITTPAPVVALTGTYTPDSSIGDLAIALPAPAVALSGTYVGPLIGTGVLDITIPAPVVDLVGGTYADPVDHTTTVDTFTRGNGRTRVGISRATVAYDPTTPPRPQQPVGIMAQQLPEPTLVDGKPT